MWNFCTDVTVPPHLHYLSFHGCQINRTSDSFLHNTFPSCLSRIFFRCMFSLKWLFSPKLPSACPSGQWIITFSFVEAVPVFSSLKKIHGAVHFSDHFYRLFFLKHYVWTCPFHSKSSPTLVSNLLMKLHERSLQIVILAVFTNFYIYSPFLCICPLSSVLSVTETLREKLWCLVTSCTIQSI